MKADVVLLTYGEPPEPVFNEQWRYSNRILYKLTRLVAPIPKAVVPLIGAYRGYTRRSLWLQQGYNSPLEGITHAQREMIVEGLNQEGGEFEWRVHCTFEFRDPDLEATLSQIEKAGTDVLIFLPMYLPISDFTTEISRTDHIRYCKSHPSKLPRPQVIVFREKLPELARLMANYIRRDLERRGVTPERRKQMGLLLGCHGTVVEAPKGIKDTGYQDTFRTFELLEQELRDDFKSIDIGWMNHRLGGEWTTPTLEDSGKRMQDQGIMDFVYFPFGFLADNAESQLEGRMALEGLGITDYIHIPCLNDDAQFIEFLTRVVIETAKRAKESAGKSKVEAA